MRRLEIEYAPIDDITPYKHNAKIHSEEQIGQIRASIEQFGFNDPIAVDEDNVIIEGHGRLLAAKEMGLEEVPIIKIIGLTDQQKKAYILAHNQLTLNTGFDLDVLADELERITDFDMADFGFDDLLSMEDVDVDSVEEDEPPAVPLKPKSKLGDVYQLGKHRVMCGDSTKAADMEKLMDGELADLVVTDPPYNVAVNTFTSVEEAKKLNHRTDGLLIANDNVSDTDFNTMLVDAFKSMYDNLKAGGAFYIFHAPTSQMIFEQALNTNGLRVREQLIWVKDRMVFNRQDYHWRHEPCFYGWKEGAAHYFIDDYTRTTIYEEEVDVDKLKKDELVEMLKTLLDETKNPTTVIHEAKPQRSDLHPTMKPVKLISRLVYNSSRPQELVLDLFGGSGSTMVACEQLNRRCYTMELDPRYVDVIVDRWERLTGEKAVRL